MSGGAPGHDPALKLGLRENLGQFLLLVLINGFVGAMVGMERSVLPLLAEREFGIASRASILSFLVAFGIVKAVANAIAGGVADRWGRKRVLLAGWLVGIPVPFLVMFAPSWEWVVAANVLLGVNQGLCWSAAIIMKVDLVGPRQRGLAIGLNESSGYLAVAGAAILTGFIAARHGLRPEPFWVGVVAALAGTVCTLLVRDTHGHSALEGALHAGQRDRRPPSPWRIAARVSWEDRSLRAVSQAGLVNNLNDAVSWGLFPLLFVSQGASLEEAAVMVAIYPAVWGVGQLLTGAWSDRYGRKWLMVGGMVIQGFALVAVTLGTEAWVRIAALTCLGAGTALVYPTFLSAVSHHSQPAWRASAIGVYRWWRDLGYAVGALLAGAVADRFGVPVSIQVVGALTVLSGVAIAVSYREPTASGLPESRG